MAYIKNDFVSMKWDAEKFFESRDSGFVAAVNTYSDKVGKDVNVVFMDTKAFVLVDSDTGDSCSMNDIVEAIKSAFDSNVSIEELYPDNYSELGTVVVDDDDIISTWGLSEEDKKDINARLDDLGGYWETTEEEMY